MSGDCLLSLENELTNLIAWLKHIESLRKSPMKGVFGHSTPQILGSQVHMFKSHVLGRFIRVHGWPLLASSTWAPLYVRSLDLQSTNMAKIGKTPYTYTLFECENRE